MADQIVSWGGFNSKGTSGMGVTGSISIVGSGSFGYSSIANGNTYIKIDPNQFNSRITFNDFDGGIGSRGGELEMSTYYSRLTYGSYNWFYIGNPSYPYLFYIGDNRRILISDSSTKPTNTNAMLTVKGTGTTSSTTSFLVQNANTSASFQVKDDLSATFGGSITVAKTGNNQLAILDTPSIEYRYNQGGSGGQRINFGFYSTTFNFVPGSETLGGNASFGIRVTGSSTTTYAFGIINGNNTNPETEFRNAFDLDGNLYFRNDSTIRAISTTFSNGGTLNVQGGQPRSDVPNGNGGTLSLNGGLGLGTGTPGDIILKTSTTGSSGTTPQSLTSRVWIKGQTGFVGIGTSSPSASLHVTGSTLITGSLTFNGSDLSTAWTSYTPTWTSDGTAPSLGDGTLTGAYKVVGKTCFVRVRLIWGTTTTSGTGVFYFDLPVSASTSWGIQMPVSMLDNGNAWYQATANGEYGGFTNKVALIGQSSGANSSQGVAYNFPFTFANLDSIQFNGSYEIA